MVIRMCRPTLRDRAGGSHHSTAGATRGVPVGDGVRSGLVIGERLRLCDVRVDVLRRSRIGSVSGVESLEGFPHHSWNYKNRHRHRVCGNRGQVLFSQIRWDFVMWTDTGSSLWRTRWWLWTEVVVPRGFHRRGPVVHSPRPPHPPVNHNSVPRQDPPSPTRRSPLSSGVEVRSLPGSKSALFSGRGPPCVPPTRLPGPVGLEIAGEVPGSGRDTGSRYRLQIEVPGSGRGTGVCAWISAGNVDLSRRPGSRPETWISAGDPDLGRKRGSQPETRISAGNVDLSRRRGSQSGPGHGPRALRACPAGKTRAVRTRGPSA